jgi:hypothetical protein
MPINPGLQLPFGIQPTNPIPVDAWSGPFTAGSLVAGVSAANAAIPSAVRFQSMEVRLIVGGVSYKYWYANGIADIDLVAFSSSIPTDYVISFNGLTGEVSGVTTGISNTFGPLQNFSSGISAFGGTFSNNVKIIGDLFVTGRIITETGLFGVTYNNAIESIDDMSMDGGEF